MSNVPWEAKEIAPWLKTTALEQAKHAQQGGNVAEENAAGGIWGVVFRAAEDTQEVTALPAETPEYRSVTLDE